MGQRKYPSRMKRAIPPDAPGADLFGYPPGRLVTCAGCGQHAEAYTGRFCWLCANSGQMDFVLSVPTVTKADRRWLLTGPGAG